MEEIEKTPEKEEKIYCWRCMRVRVARAGGLCPMCNRVEMKRWKQNGHALKKK